MKFTVVILLTLANLIVSKVEADSVTGPVVKIESGAVRGYEDQDVNGRKFFAFTGVPYAEPPTGKLRFQNPVPVQKWTDTLDATKPIPLCPQHPFDQIFLHNMTTMIGQEDCLHLNVFTPKLSDKDGKGLPVMLFIHGGAYLVGGATLYAPYSLVSEDVVLVVVNYRLGALGFFSTDDDAAPGNLAMKDQNLALRWVQKNIKQFGGDPGLVTLFGESAGAAFTHFHTLLPDSAGLFKRAIIQSGAASCPWATANSLRKEAFQVGTHLGCVPDEGGEDTHKLVECLQEKHLVDVVESLGHFMTFGILPLLFRPVIDGKYLTDNPINLMKQKKHQNVDLMVGYTTDEGAFLSSMVYSSNQMLKQLTENFEETAPLSLCFMGDSWEPQRQAKTIFRHYFGDFVNFDTGARTFTEMSSDRLFKICGENNELQWINNLAGTEKKVFSYEFSYRGEQSFTDMFPMHLLKDKELGRSWVSHVDELAYLFAGGLMFRSHENPQDREMSRKMVKMWANFAKTGNPTPDDSLGYKWQPSEKGSYRRLVMTSEPYMQDDQRQQVRKFWSSLPLPENFLWEPERFQVFQDLDVKLHESEAKNRSKSIKLQGAQNVDREHDEL